MRTPNLDRLAGLGVNFTNAYVQNTVCVPSRACIQTGRYTHQHGVRYMETAVDATPGLQASSSSGMSACWWEDWWNRKGPSWSPRPSELSTTVSTQEGRRIGPLVQTGIYLSATGQRRTRTADTMIFSHVLYHLSYLPTSTVFTGRVYRNSRRPSRPSLSA